MAFTVLKAHAAVTPKGDAGDNIEWRRIDMPADTGTGRVLDHEHLAEIFRRHLCDFGGSRTNAVIFRRCRFGRRNAVALKRVPPAKLNYSALRRNTPHLNAAPRHRSKQSNQIVLFPLIQEIWAQLKPFRYRGK